MYLDVVVVKKNDDEKIDIADSDNLKAPPSAAVAEASGAGIKNSDYNSKQQHSGDS